MQDEGQNQSSPETNWQFKPGETISPGTTEQPEHSQQPEQLEQTPQMDEYELQSTTDSTVSWSASEFVSHQKTFGWYILLILAVLAASAVIYLLTRSFISALTILLAGTLFGVFAFMTRKPRTLQYSITQTGVQIGQRLYLYSELKAFTIQPEGPINSVVLLPMRRFMPPITMYYDPKDEDRIAEALSNHLPFDEEHNDPVDNFMRKIRY